MKCYIRRHFLRVYTVQSSGTEKTLYRNFDLQPLQVQNGLFYTYCINRYGIIHQNEKGLTKGISLGVTMVQCIIPDVYLTSGHMKFILNLDQSFSKIIYSCFILLLALMAILFSGT